MSAKDILPKPGITVTLGGQKYKVRFTMKSLAWLSDRYETISGVIAALSSLKTGNMGAKELHAIADLVCAGLQHHDDLITPEYIEDNFDFGEIKAILPEIMQAYKNAMGVKEGTGNPPKA
jgi:hypothetical protein